VEPVVTANSGNGGGGGSGNLSGGNGGSGVVIIRYPATYPAVTTSTNATVTVTGGYRIYTFNQSGSITL
jgi:hypothetical protein